MPQAWQQQPCRILASGARPISLVDFVHGKQRDCRLFRQARPPSYEYVVEITQFRSEARVAEPTRSRVGIFTSTTLGFLGDDRMNLGLFHKIQFAYVCAFISTGLDFRAATR
jgi:hypothetical protein